MRFHELYERDNRQGDYNPWEAIPIIKFRLPA